DAARDLNTLYLKPIARANAVQRAGRAGRTAPGTCIRLWDAMRESVMAARLDPEIRRVELSEAALAWHALFEDAFRGDATQASQASHLSWPTPPDLEGWARAEAKLTRIAALRDRRITPLGRDLMNWPASPDLARVLRDAAVTGDRALMRQVAAMAAVLSSGKRGGGTSGGKNSADLFILGEDLAAEPKTGDREQLAALRQFLKLMDRAGAHPEVSRPAPVPASAAPASASDSALETSGTRQGGGEATAAVREQATKLFLPVYVQRLAARTPGGNSFQLEDGRKGVA